MAAVLACASCARCCLRFVFLAGTCFVSLKLKRHEKDWGKISDDQINGDYLTLKQLPFPSVFTQFFVRIHQ
jgi:hypothetical protein